MEAVGWIHAAMGLALLGALVLLAVTALLALRAPVLVRWIDPARRMVLGLLVAEAALGLTLALRGSAPAEGIHWLYGVAVIGVLLVPGAVGGTQAARRGTIVAVAAGLAAVFGWRLWGSG